MSYKTIFGDATNYVNLSSTGILLNGTAKYKSRERVPVAGLGKAVAAPVNTYVGNYMGLAFAINDTVYYNISLPYRWDELTAINANLLWAINEAYATNSGEVQWQLDWSATPKDMSEALDAPTHFGTLVTGDINIPVTAKTLADTTFSTSVPQASLSAHDLLGFKLSRIAIVAGNNPTAAPIAFELELVMTFNKLGEIAT